MHFMIGCFVISFIRIYNNKKMRKEKCVLCYCSWTCNQGWPYYLHISFLCTLISLDELILLHFTSVSDRPKTN